MRAVTKCLCTNSGKRLAEWKLHIQNERIPIHLYIYVILLKMYNETSLICSTDQSIQQINALDVLLWNEYFSGTFSL